MREINEPHVAQNAQVASDSAQSSVDSSAAASCPSGSSSISSPSPLFERTFVPAIQFDLDSAISGFDLDSAISGVEQQKIINQHEEQTHPERKRRRVIGNLDNTLDGLVAKRADLDPNAKRYQTENEAIELPDDELEMKRLETDPDVSTRMCSVCGYQGKWVSEMIRHKRVHTSERPFKCKYCNRTSKWKADLIRHVAKTHGIRVVSKYSRSKAFDETDNCDDPALEVVKLSKKRDQNNNKQSKHSIIQKPATFKPSLQGKLSLAPPSSLTYKCSSCLFEQNSMDMLTTHLRLAHNLAPFECRRCKLHFGAVQQVSTHCASHAAAGCTPLQIKINFQITESTLSQIPNTSSFLRPDGLLTIATNPGSSIPQAPTDSDTVSSAPSSCSSNTDYELSTQPGLSLHSCLECPYRTPSLQRLETHRSGHQTPRGLFNYKCVFCNWFSKKKSAIEKHMQVHTSKPSQFMNQVERNFMTPLTTSANILGGASAPIQQPIAPPAPSTALGFLSALYSANNGALFGGSPPVQTTTPEMSALKELSTNPLLAFSLCSLLRDNLAQQQPSQVTQTALMPFLGSTPPGLLQATSNRLGSAFNYSHLI